MLSILSGLCFYCNHSYENHLNLIDFLMFVTDDNLLCFILSSSGGIIVAGHLVSKNISVCFCYFFIDMRIWFFPVGYVFYLGYCFHQLVGIAVCSRLWSGDFVNFLLLSVLKSAYFRKEHLLFTVTTYCFPGWVSVVEVPIRCFALTEISLFSCILVLFTISLSMLVGVEVFM